ncbi:MAG: hypothetical protein PVI40_05310 [Chlamydiota bacterium]
MSSTSAADVAFPRVIWGNIMSFLPPEEQILNSRVSRTWYNVSKTNLGQFALMRAISSSKWCAYLLITRKPELIDRLITLAYNEVLNPNSKFTGEFLSAIIECKFEIAPSEVVEYLHDLTEKQRAMVETLQFPYNFLHEFTDEQVAEIIKLCPNLKSLALTKSNITGECFAHIPDGCHLEKLCLPSCENLNEIFLAQLLSKVAYLKILDLSYTKITGECLAQIPKRNYVERFDLSGCKNLNEIFLAQFLSKAAKLKELDLCGVNITGKCLAYVPEENNLERLILQLCCELKEGLFKEFFRLKGAHLKELNLSNTKITGECLAHVPEKNCLKKLYLSSCKNLNERYFIRFFQRVAYLKEIDLSYTKIKGKCLSCIPEKNCLESLCLVWCQGLEEEFLIKFFQKAAHLKKVDLSYTNTTGESFFYIPKINQLSKLCVSCCRELDFDFLKGLPKGVLSGVDLRE